MNNSLIKIFIFSILLGAFMSCEEEDKNVYEGESYISFGKTTSSSALESTTAPITITAYASIPNLQNDITVDFSISSDNATSANYTVLDNKTSFSFGVDKYTDQIQILPIDNFDEDGEKSINITLTNSSGGYTLGLPGPDAHSNTYVVTIQDDDCAFSLQELGDATWSGVDSAPGSQAGPNASQITTSFDGTNLLIEGIAYGWLTDTAFWDEVVVVSHKVIAIVDPITGAISIAEQPLCTTTWLGNVQDDYSIVATGQYVSCSETMVIDYDLLQSGGVRRSFTETITIN